MQHHLYFCNTFRGLPNFYIEATSMARAKEDAAALIKPGALVDEEFMENGVWQWAMHRKAQSREYVGTYVTFKKSGERVALATLSKIDLDI